ncbi:MAG: 50S ribosomal protein L7Ae [Candidatus Atabeyarchaeum deiterrae]|jgi:large subunit ribosomal protein L7Ae
MYLLSKKFEAPKELVDKAYHAIELARKSGKVKRGTNEATKTIERGIAKLVVIAADVDPPEIVAPIPYICDEKKIPFIFVPSKEKLGNACGIDVPAAAVAITEGGEAEKIVKEIVEKLKEIRETGKPKKE